MGTRQRGIIAHTGGSGKIFRANRGLRLIKSNGGVELAQECYNLAVLAGNLSAAPCIQWPGVAQADQGEIVHKVIIIGSGCAGLTAAIYTARADLKPLVLDGYEPGGQLALTTDVENFPGFPEGILGPEFVERARKQAQRFRAEFRAGAVVTLRGLEQAGLSKLWPAKETYEAETLGSFRSRGRFRLRMLGLPSERDLLGHGVSTCATCDGAFFRNQDIIVVGGGDTAMEEATFLTRYAKSVTLVHRRNEFRASKIMLDRARAHEKIKFLTPYTVEEIHDVTSKSVETIKLRKHVENSMRCKEMHGGGTLCGHRTRSEHQGI